jgi:hypothetical protein
MGTISCRRLDGKTNGRDTDKMDDTGVEKDGDEEPKALVRRLTVETSEAANVFQRRSTSGRRRGRVVETGER